MKQPEQPHTMASSSDAIATSGHSRAQRSYHGSGMESSVFRFKDVNFVATAKGQDRHILRDVSGTCKWGHVLAVMGPSGAGKSVLISALTLDAFFGKPYGSVTLNNVPLTDRIFKEHCYVVVQHDKHFPYLTCRETLRYAAELYAVAAQEDMDLVVDDVIDKMGLRICAETRNARLSGGQARRLSIGIGLLKQPTLLFLDEPTSGKFSDLMLDLADVASPRLTMTSGLV
jgi:ABC-type multidrug transport system ATPase subunit